MRNKLKVELDKLIDKKVLEVNAGSGGGSIINIEFGESLNISPKSFGSYKIFEGDFSIMIYCAWRLESNESVLTSWNEDNSDNGPIVTNLKNLINNRVISYEISDLFDLKIFFEEQKALTIFCDLSTEQEFECNWFLRNNNNIYSITNKYICEQEAK